MSNDIAKVILKYFNKEITNNGSGATAGFSLLSHCIGAEENIDVTNKDNKGRTILHFIVDPNKNKYLSGSASYTLFNMIDYLVSQDKKILDMQDNCGNTPLLAAGMSDQRKIVDYLVFKGSNPQIKNKNGYYLEINEDDKLIRKVKNLNEIIEIYENRHDVFVADNLGILLKNDETTNNTTNISGERDGPTSRINRELHGSRKLRSFQ